MNKPDRALIIGGGIAGPVAAMALKRVGIAATVFEAHPADTSGAGAFLTVAVNGLAALRTLGLDQPVMAAGFPTGTIELASGTGKRLATVPLGGTSGGGAVAHTIRRSDLYRVLSAEATRRGIRIEHGKRLVDARTTPDGGVVVCFEDGTSAAGDL